MRSSQKRFDHRGNFYLALQETAKDTMLLDLQNKLFPKYREIHAAFSSSPYGLAIAQVEEEAYLVALVKSTNTPMQSHISLTNGLYQNEPHLEERAELRDSICLWADEWGLSPRYWLQESNWFLELIVFTLSNWYHNATAYQNLELGMFSYLVGKSESNSLPKNIPDTVAQVPFKLDIPDLMWNLQRESEPEFRKRALSHVDAHVKQYLDSVIKQLPKTLESEGLDKKGNKKPKQTRDMQRLVKRHVLRMTYEEIAMQEHPNPDEAPEIEEIRKAVERRAKDIGLFLRS